MKLTPYVIGSGMAAGAIEMALSNCALQSDFKYEFAPKIKIGRDEKLKDVIKSPKEAIVVIANPHGLHASKILEADKIGVMAIFAEKPVCTNLEDLKELQRIKTPTTVFHGYRYLWGPNFVKTKMDLGELGEIISVEGRYWQGSEGSRVLDPTKSVKAWKADAVLSGGQDVLFDLASHWMDLVLFLLKDKPFSTDIWLYHHDKNSHRDSHVHLITEGATRTFGSISKIFHGGTNNLELSVVGTRGSLQWTFLEPDLVKHGQGDKVTHIYRSDSSLGTGLPAFHATGWMEGYVEVIRQALMKSKFNLSESLIVMETILNANTRRV